MWGLVEQGNEMNISRIMEWCSVSLLLAILFAIVDILTFIQLFEIKIDKKRKRFIIGIYSILRFLNVLFVPYPIYRGVNLLLAVAIFKICLKESWEKCVYGEVVNSTGIILLECIFTKIYCTFFPEISTYSVGIHDYSYKITIGVSIIIMRLLIYYFLESKNVTISLNKNISRENKARIIIVSFIGFSIILSNAIFLNKFIYVFPYSVCMLSMLTLLTCFYLSIREIFRINKMKESDDKINNLEMYNNTLQIMYDNIRGFRHDYNNFIQALDGYAKSDNLDGIKSMMKSAMNECIEINNMNILDPKIINNPAVYSIITNKFYLAQKNNINMNIEIMTNIDEIDVPTYELCRILGILLDNAIEAAKQCDKKIINILFKNEEKRHRKIIVIENSCEADNIDIEKIFEKGYSTKKENLNKHGLGLWNVRKILNKFSNLNLYTSKNEFFSQQLEIY